MHYQKPPLTIPLQFITLKVAMGFPDDWQIHPFWSGENE